MASKIEVEVVGLRELIDKVRTDRPFYAPALQSGLAGMGKTLEALVRSRGPNRGGRLRGAAFSKTSKLPGKWLVVGTKAAAGKSGRSRATKATGRRTRYPYPYPRRLEFDRKSRHRDWLKKLIDKGTVQREMNGVAAAVKKAWGN
jgi:hypothetical protein